MRKTVLVGMSGGVDSSVAAALLKEEYNVLGVTLKLHCHESNAVEDAQKVCQRLGIEHHVRDYSKEFKSCVIDDFVSEYEKARTPNPCVWCNYHIKFGVMLDLADELGADYIATGHYVRKEKIGDTDEYILRAASELDKDQTYALYRLNSRQLARSLFPLGEIPKSRVREIAASIGLEVADKKDSQEICFIPSGDYAAYIEQATGKKSQPGKFIGPSGQVLGEHNGLIRYTVGQRRGLGIAYSERLYVERLDPESNCVYLGCEGVQNTRTVSADNITFISGKPPAQEFDALAKIRYNGSAAPAHIKICDGEIKAEFASPVRAAAPGQSLVIYDGDCVLGGGIIK